MAAHQKAAAKEDAMKATHVGLLGAVVGMAMGAIAVQSLHAQQKGPVYYIAMNEVTNQDAYVKEFAPKSQALAKKMGGKFLTAGGKVTPMIGTPPTARIVLQQWDSLEKLEAWYKSPENQEILKIGQQYAKFNSFAVEGVAP